MADTLYIKDSEDIFSLLNISDQNLPGIDERVTRLEDIVLTLDVSEGGSIVTVVADISTDVAAGTIIELPAEASGKQLTYGVANNALVVTYNGVWLYKDEHYEEIGESNAVSSHIRMLHELRAGDKLSFQIFANNVGVLVDGASIKAVSGQGLSVKVDNETLETSDTGVAIKPITSTGSTTPRDIRDRFSDVINVKDFGAVGDGVTDDTAAIQAAANIPNSTIYFPDGVYCISDTIHLFGNDGGQKIEFGGAHIKYIGEEDDSAVMFSVDKSGAGVSGKCIIFGGTINGDGKAGVCIQNKKFHTTIIGSRVINPKKIAIRLASFDDESDTISSQCILSDLTINCSKQDLALLDTIGISVVDTDNKLSNIQIDGIRTCIQLKNSGNILSNIQTCPRLPGVDGGYTAETFPDIDTKNIEIAPLSGATYGSNLIENLYANSGRYVIYYTRTSNMATIVNNSEYLTHSELVKDGIVQSFIVGGKAAPPVSFNNFVVRSCSRNNVFDYFPEVILSGNNLYNDIDVATEIPPLAGTQLIDATHLVTSSKMRTLKLDGEIAANTLCRMACVFGKISADSSYYKTLTPFDIEYMRGRDYYVKATVRYTGSKWAVADSKVVYGTKPEFIDIIIDNTIKYIMINSRKYAYFDVYIHNKGSEPINGGIGSSFSIRPLPPATKAYLYKLVGSFIEDSTTEIPTNYTVIA